jgi:hypothetical protein
VLERWINATTESALGVSRLADLYPTGLHVHKTRREANRCWISDEKVSHSNFGPRPLLAPLRHADEHRECLLSRVFRNPVSVSSGPVLTQFRHKTLGPSLTFA